MLSNSQSLVALVLPEALKCRQPAGSHKQGQSSRVPDSCSLQVVDDNGSEHEVLLRSFLHGHGETMYLLDRLATLLHTVNAQPGDMLMLSRDENGPVVCPYPPFSLTYLPACPPTPLKKRHYL